MALPQFWIAKMWAVGRVFTWWKMAHSHAWWLKQCHLCETHLNLRCLSERQSRKRYILECLFCIVKDGTLPCLMAQIITQIKIQIVLLLLEPFGNVFVSSLLWQKIIFQYSFRCFLCFLAMFWVGVKRQPLRWHSIVIGKKELGFVFSLPTFWNWCLVFLLSPLAKDALSF